MAATYQDDSSDSPLTRDDPGSTAATATNRREYARVRPDDRNQLAASLTSGSQVRLIDLSRGGAQFECERRFLPNASVSLRLRTRDGEVPVTGRVVRSRIVRLASGGLGYTVGVAFSNLLPTDPGEDDHAAAPFRHEAPDAQALQTVDVPPVASMPTATDNAVIATEPAADITAAEALAFEATAEFAPTMMTVTATVDTTSEQLHDMFNGNDW